MNILENLNFNQDKPATKSIHKSSQTNYLAIGLLKNQILKKHKASVPTVLTVLKGSIHFIINNEAILLNQFDTYEIPVSIEHEVIGLDKMNVFTLMQERQLDL